MRRERTIFLFVIMYTLVFTTIYFINSSERKTSLEILDIGIICPSDKLSPKYEYISKLAQEKINKYCNQSSLNMRFNFINTNAAGDPKNAMEITKKFYKNGVNFIVGYGWNSHLNASYAFAMENNMVIVSPSSTFPAFAQDDKCFRLLPDDQREIHALTDAIINYGIDTVIILHRNDPWGNNFADNFHWEYRKNGGEVVDWISYTPDKLQSINKAINRATVATQDSVNHMGEDRVGILLLAHEEASDVLLVAENSPILMNVTWFCSETNTVDENIRQNAGHVASKVSLIGPLNTHIYNEDYQEVSTLYISEFNEPLDFTLANVYDGCWLLALSVIEADSNNPIDVSEVFGDIAYNHYGITGPLDINSVGDRSMIRYYFYGYYEVNGNVVFLRVGRYTRLEKHGTQGSSISHSPYLVIYDNFPYYVWDKEFEAK